MPMLHNAVSPNNLSEYAILLRRIARVMLRYLTNDSCGFLLPIFDKTTHLAHRTNPGDGVFFSGVSLNDNPQGLSRIVRIGS